MDKFVSQTETSLKKKKKNVRTPKGRQVEDKYLRLEVSKLFSGLIFKRDELIEYLHTLQDNLVFCMISIS